MKQTVQAKRETKRNISHLTKPKELSLDDWQIVLRRQVADSGNFIVKNTGSEQIFSTFQVANPQTERSYRVVICGEKLGINYCSCPDFSVNTLGTCKHVEYVLNKLRKKRGASKLLKAGYIPAHSSLTLRYGLQRRVAICLGMRASSKLKELAAQFFDQEGFLTEWGFSHFDQFVERANILNDELHYHEDAMNFIANIRDVEIRKMRINKMFPQGCNDTSFNHLIKTDLYPYQKAGAFFAALAGRSLIADDMGLGKTPQAIAASEILARALGIEKVLIICPTSLKHQWKKESEKFIRSVETATGAIPAGSEQNLQTEFKEAMEDAKISQEEVSEDSVQEKETKTIQPPAIITQETIGEFLRAGAAFLQKISQQFDTSTKPVKGEAVLAGKEKFSGIKIERDKNTGQQTLQIPLPGNQTMEKLLQIGSVFLSMLKK